MTRSTTIFLAVMAVAGATAAPALAQDGVRPVDDTILAESRGGFIVVDGLTLDFGAVIRSFLDGALVLETKLSMFDGGLTADRAGPADAGLSSQSLNALDTAGLAALGLSPETKSYVSSDGSTAFIHRLGDGGLANVLLNTANGRDLRQDTALTVTLPGFEAVQGQMTAAAAGRQLTQDMQLSSVGLIP